MITNSCLYIADEHLSVQFYLEKLNFLLSNTMMFAGEQWWLLEDTSNECNRLVLIKKHDSNTFKGAIIMNIKDCIYEYCKLKQANVAGLSEPIYSTIGLAVSFFDPDGNRIILLEERNYEDPFIL